MSQTNNSRKKQQSVKEKREASLIAGLHSLEHTRRNSIIIAIVIVALVFILAIVIYALKKDSFNGALLTSSAIGLGVAIIWIVFKFGLFDRSRLKFINYRNKQVVKTVNSKMNVSMDIKKYREYNKKKSWHGALALILIMVILIIITIAIEFS